MVANAPRPIPATADTTAARLEIAHRHAALPPVDGLDDGQIVALHTEFRDVAEALSGRTVDSRQRATVYYSIYEDSAGNFMFPMIASHGSMWGIKHTLRIQGFLDRFGFLLGKARLQRWTTALDAVRDVNRRVFVEIHSTFYFTRFYGRHPAAAQVVKPDVLALYNRIHAAIDEGVLLPYAERRQIYYDVFRHEQNDIVDPGVNDAARACQNPFMVSMLRVVRPRFAYFPKGERLRFTDFTSVDQRNREGLRALDFGEQVGAARVLEALGEY